MVAEKIDVRKVQVGTSGVRTLTIPQSYADDMGLTKGSEVEVFRKGETLIIRPKKERA